MSQAVSGIGKLSSGGRILMIRAIVLATTGNSVYLMPNTCRNNIGSEPVGTGCNISKNGRTRFGNSDEQPE
jgi:hypothetical protein